MGRGCSGIDKVLRSTVWLKPGGSIIVNETEALVALDVNTGRATSARRRPTASRTPLSRLAWRRK